MASFRQSTVKFGVRKGQALQGRFSATLVGGPELAAALKRLEAACQAEAAKSALRAAGAVIQDNWRDRIKLGPGTLHYRNAIQVRTSKTKKGASGSVLVRKLGGATKEDAEPLAYAHKEEFGGPDGHGGFVPAHPAARPAFDTSKGRAVDAAETVLRRAVARVAP